MSDVLSFFWASLGRRSDGHIKSSLGSSPTSMSNHFLLFIRGVGEKGTLCNNSGLQVPAMFVQERQRDKEGGVDALNRSTINRGLDPEALGEKNM